MQTRQQLCQGCSTSVFLCLSTSSLLNRPGSNIAAVSQLFMIHTWVVDASLRAGGMLKVRKALWARTWRAAGLYGARERAED